MAKRAVDLGAKPAPGKTQTVESITEGMAKADIIFTCLANDEAVKETIGKALGSDFKGKLFVECSTIQADTTEAMA